MIDVLSLTIIVCAAFGSGALAVLAIMIGECDRHRRKGYVAGLRAGQYIDHGMKQIWPAPEIPPQDDQLPQRGAPGRSMQ
jgi:hypothetical protein